MEVNEATLSTLSQYVQQTLDPVRGKEAEAFLKANEHAQGYVLCLLKLIETESNALDIRLASAILFKNVIKRKWPEVSTYPFLLICVTSLI